MQNIIFPSVFELFMEVRYFLLPFFILPALTLLNSTKSTTGLHSMMRRLIINLLLYSHNLSIPKFLRPNVNNHRTQDKDELLRRHRPIHLNNMGNGYIQIRHIPYHKMDTSA